MKRMKERSRRYAMDRVKYDTEYILEMYEMDMQ